MRVYLVLFSILTVTNWIGTKAFTDIHSPQRVYPSSSGASMKLMCVSFEWRISPAVCADVLGAQRLHRSDSVAHVSSHLTSTFPSVLFLKLLQSQKRSKTPDTSPPELYCEFQMGIYQM